MPNMTANPLLAWLCLLASVLIVAGYELRFRIRAQRQPLHFARTAHARLRMRWVHDLMQTPGTELLAIQTIRNSVMSATVTASTAVLALMGVLSLLSSRLGQADIIAFSPKAVLMALLIAILFATFMLSAMAVRFFNHAGYLMGSQAQGEIRQLASDTAARYIVRAGNYYSQGMRTLLWLPPAAIGLLGPGFMLLAALVLVFVMAWFDRSPEPLDERLLTIDEVPR